MKIFGLYREEEIALALTLRGHERILDVGGGTGHLAGYLARKCEQVTIIDSSSGMLSRAGRYPGVEKIYGDFLEFSFPRDESYDAIILSDTIHHIPLSNHDTLIRRSGEFLKPGGLILIYDFNPETVAGKIISLFESLFFKTLAFRKCDDIVSMLERNSFNIIEKRYGKSYFIFTAEKRN